MSDKQTANVRIGHTMRLTTAVAIGSLVTVGLTIYLFLGAIFSIAGTEAPTTYALTLFFFLPFALALAERSSVTPGRGGLFNLSRSSESLPLAFTTGWLLVGGLLSLAAIFAWEGGLALSELLNLFFGIQLKARWLAILIISLVFLHTLSQTTGVWKKRSTFLYAAIILLTAILLAAWFAPLEIPTTWVYLPSSKLFLSIPYVAVGLWGMQFVLDHRDALRRPRRQMFTALYLPTVIGGLLGAVAAATLLLYPSLTYLEAIPLLTVAEYMHPLLPLLLLLVMIGIGFIGAHESLANLRRLSKALSGDGFLPEHLRFRRRVIERPSYVLLAFLLVPTLLILFESVEIMIALATGSILIALILVNIQDLLRAKPRLASNRRPRLPFHPLIPGISAALALTILLTQELKFIVSFLPWLLFGALIYFAFAREGAIDVRRRDALVAGAILPAKKTSYRVMVALFDPSKAASLIRLGLSIAAAHDGILVILRVAPLAADEEIDPQTATDAWQDLYNLISFQDELRVTTTPLIRFAPTAAAGILTTVWEEKIDLVILGWPENNVEGIGERDGTIGQIVQKAQCEVVVLRGHWTSAVSNVLVPVISAGHSEAALSLGQDIIIEGDSAKKVVALRVIHGKLTDEKRQQAEHQLRQTRSNLDNPSGIIGEVIGSTNTRESILQESGDYDAMLIGLSDEGFLAETDFSGLPVDVAQNATVPTLLVKRKEKPIRYWLRRSWDMLAAVLPKLSPKRRAVVGADMRHNARADVDFYVLMLLAASIALFGLLQDSAAVIIGAMLVAPLMSPILAMSHSIVRGQLDILRQAAESTLNGVVLAISVGALLSLSLVALGIPISPTSEILARTQPNFLDLLVALASGAAAAYAISRSEVSAALPGVAIAAALVPPLAVVGYGLGTAQFDFAAGSLLLFLTNLAAIILAAAVVFLLLGIRPPVRDDRDTQARTGLRIAVISFILIAIPLFASTRVSADQAAIEKTVIDILDNYWPSTQAEVEDIVVIQAWDEDISVSCTIYDYAGVATDQSLAQLQSSLSSTLGEPVVLEARTINASLNSYNDTSASRLLTQTPTPTSVDTAGAASQSPPTGTPLPTPSATPLPTETITSTVPATKTPFAGESPTALTTPSPVAAP